MQLKHLDRSNRAENLSILLMTNMVISDHKLEDAKEDD